MADGMLSNGAVREINGSDQSNDVIDIYPLSSYYFGSKEASPFKDETLADRIQRMKFKYTHSQHTNSLICLLNWVRYVFICLFVFLTFLFLLRLAMLLMG